MASIRYSPEPIGAYKIASMFKLLADDETAWNLAYLSWDFEATRGYPDAHFSVHCHRTLQFIVETGEFDLIAAVPNKYKVRGLMSCPPPQAAYRIANLSRMKELPLFRAYGQTWLDTLYARSRLYRELHDVEFDFEIKSLAQALNVIERCS
jgi:hypothetical protein